MLRKYKELAPVYSNSTTKTETGIENILERSFFKYVDKWISEGSGWIVESIDAENVNISF